MSVWQEIRELIIQRGDKALADRVLELTEAERAEVAKQLPGFLKERRVSAADLAREKWIAEHGADLQDSPWAQAWLRRQTSETSIVSFGTALRIAGAGTISGPATAAAWLARRDFDPAWGSRPLSPEMLRVVTSRPADWQDEVATRLAEKIRTAGDRLAPLVLGLFRVSAIEPPRHDPLVVAWLAAEEVDDDPLLGRLLPRIFEAEGVGRALREERLTPTPTRWLARLRELLGAGRVSRAELLDGCVSRFLRGGDANGLRFFVRLHEMIEPTPQEGAERARDYLRLLPAAPGPVAELALAQLRRTGPHDSADVGEAVDALAFRAEAKLARAGLTWLDEQVRRAPASAEELAPGLATAFAHSSYEVQCRAVTLALKHAAAFQASSALIAEAVPQLPADLGEQVAAKFGGDIATHPTPTTFTPTALPDPAKPEPFPDGVMWPSYMLHEWTAGELWLAAFVEEAGRDRAALREKLQAEFHWPYPQRGGWKETSDWISSLAGEIISPRADSRRLPEPSQVSAPFMFLVRRFHEIYVALREEALPPVLLATPTLRSGHVDPEVLLERLEACAAAGVEPLAADLQQALLRLPRGSHPAAAERAARLGSPAASAVAAWMAGGGLKDPETGVLEERGRLVPVLRAEPTGHELIDQLLVAPSPSPRSDHARSMDWWRSILPSHREVVSVNFLPYVEFKRHHSYFCASHLASLTDGPVGEATALLLAFLLADHSENAVPTLLRMAATGDLPAEAVGRWLSWLVRREKLEKRPVLASLTEAAQQGAHAQVWEILQIALPALLPGKDERPTITHSEIVALAADLAVWVGARGEIPAVSAHAGSGRGSRFARECARLRDQLG
ncbi:hypothetical protein GCM10009555_087850 [Acrocarpospora macrocephala]|uniref:DUF7824 domain-containing protein n=1 Tax=Acrocarpospora macrocephala TaxID=150177 RepID=A0A5M3WL75_9ACTN|nr:DUF6493 family protein [Acrocarpospora macrocephala]GES08782.1 hypothetical protein Amac_023780 [Acrocarpospora macrocephala]